MRAALLLPLLTLALACSKTMTLEDEAARADFNERGPRWKGRVVLHDGQRIAARDFRADADSLWFRPRKPGTAATRALPLAQVREVDLVSHGRGALKGLLGVGSPSTALFVGIGTSSFAARMGMAVGGAMGAIGCGIGAVAGDHRHYWPEKDSLAAWQAREK